VMLERFCRSTGMLRPEIYEFWRDLTQSSLLYDGLRRAVAGEAAVDWPRLREVSLDWRNWFDHIGAKEQEGVEEFVGSMFDYFNRHYKSTDGRRRWGDLSRQDQLNLVGRIRRQARTLVALVWCARKVASHPERFRNAIDAAEFHVMTLEDDVREIHEVDRNHLWGWLRSFVPDAPSRSPIFVDIALWGETIDAESQAASYSMDGGDAPATPTRSAEVVQLQLEVLDRGVAEVFLHPADALSTQCEADFNTALVTAWAAARARLGDLDALACGRYRILRGGQPIAEVVRGGSAGGAAFRGWWHALQGKVPDSELIVLTTLKKSGREYELGNVNGLPGKVEAIARVGRHDTISVASATQAHEVRQLIERFLPEEKLVPRVVDLSHSETNTQSGT
jgi:hypothetical protein